MTIKVSCPHCDKTQALADSFAGERVRCKACERLFAVPGGEDDQRRPSLRRGGRRKANGGIPFWVWLLGGAAMFLLLLVGGGVFLFLVLRGGFGSVSEENFWKLKEGMSMLEVRQILGSPGFDDEGEGRNFMGQRISPDGSIRVWAWEKKPDYLVDVEFHNGRLAVAKGTFAGKFVRLDKPGEAVFLPRAGGNPPPAGNPPAVRPPQAQRPPVQPPQAQPPQGQRPPAADPLAEFGVRRGMTEAELVAKLGPPDEAKDLPGRRDLKWFKGKRVIGVALIKGKVSGTSLSYRR